MMDVVKLNAVGTGNEKDPFRSADGTAGIQSALDAQTCGGRVNLSSGRYELSTSLVVDTSSLCLSGDVWSCNTDPNGVFESSFGTKLRLRGQDYPAILVGKTCDPVSGAIIRDLGVQGDIPGMDTRPLVDFSAPDHSAGLCFDQVRTDQCEFSKLSFCGLANAVVASGQAELDACLFEKLNMDGCGNGIYFAPRASYYVRVRSCIIADNPYYGVYACGRNLSIHNLEISDTHFVRNGGCFTHGDGLRPAAVLLDGLSRCAITHCLFDDPGTFWYYDDNAIRNDSRQPSHRATVALHVIGDENRIRDNTFLHSSDDSIRVQGHGNVLLSNIVDGNVRICGSGNQVVNLVFTRPDSRLILEGDAAHSTIILGVPPERILSV